MSIKYGLRTLNIDENETFFKNPCPLSKIALTLMRNAILDRLKALRASVHRQRGDYPGEGQAGGASG